MKRSGVAPKIYQQTLVKIRSTLGVRIGVSVRDVAMQFGVLSLLPMASRILQQYKRRIREQMSYHQSQYMKFDNPAFEASALSLAATKRRVQVDYKRLISAVGTTAVEFKRVRTSMIELCGDMIGISKKKRKRRVESKTKDVDEKEAERQTEAENVIPGYEKTEEAAAAKAQREYQKWRESVVKSQKAESKRKDKRAAKKQKSILAFTTSPKSAKGKSCKTNVKADGDRSGRNELESLLSASFA